MDRETGPSGELLSPLERLRELEANKDLLLEVVDLLEGQGA